MRRPTIALFALVLGLILACSGGGDATKKKRKPKHDKPTTEAPANAVDAYLADCHHVFPSELEYADDADNECLAFEVDQNCGSDPSGCWEKGENCKSGCGKTCSSCQTQCGDGCDSCKSTCDGDKKCERQCAKNRSQCRDKCMSKKANCNDKRCPTQQRNCYDQFDNQIAKRCPDCDRTRECIANAWSDQSDWREACAFPNNAKLCLEWCTPGM